VEGYGEDGEGGYFGSTNGNGLVATTSAGTYAGAFYGAVYLSSGYTTSDRNLKQNVQEFDGALSVINKLKPRHYTFKTDEKYTFLRLPKGNHYGLMAQDVEEVLPSLVSTASHDVKKIQKHNGVMEPRAKGLPAAVMQQSAGTAKETLSIKAVNYIELIPIIIKGMQELSEKDKEVEALKAEVAELRHMVLELKSDRTHAVTSTSAYLEQNSPNPVRGSTIIRYHLPETSVSARLTVTNAKGQVVKTISIINKGTGQVNFDASMLAAGTYHYTLYTGSKQADSKRMVIVR
jgi:hypothetical protein